MPTLCWNRLWIVYEVDLTESILIRYADCMALSFGICLIRVLAPVRYTHTHTLEAARHMPALFTIVSHILSPTITITTTITTIITIYFTRTLLRVKIFCSSHLFSWASFLICYVLIHLSFTFFTISRLDWCKFLIITNYKIIADNVQCSQSVRQSTLLNLMLPIGLAPIHYSLGKFFLFFLQCRVYYYDDMIIIIINIINNSNIYDW